MRMVFDSHQVERLTAAARAQAKLEALEMEAQKHAMLPRRTGRGGIRRWLGWLFIAAVLVWVVYWFASLG